MIKAWMRDLEVILTSATLKNSITFGGNWKKGKEDASIIVTGNKYLSSLKDEFTVKISNLTYAEIINLTAGQYFTIEIKAGYRTSSTTSNANSIFKGEVMYISNELNSNKTHTVIILCASKLIAKYGQTRMNLSLNSGINMYSALSFIAKRAGMSNVHIDESLRQRIIRETSSVSSTAQSWLQVFTSKNNFVANTDLTSGSVLTVINPYKTNNRVITLDSNKIILSGDYPKLTTDGLTLDCMPTFNFMPADVIQLDNSIIDISATSKSDVYSNVALWLDNNGKYMIYELNYNLSNRGQNYIVTIKAKSRSLYTKICQSGTVGGYNNE